MTVKCLLYGYSLLARANQIFRSRLQGCECNRRIGIGIFDLPKPGGFILLMTRLRYTNDPIKITTFYLKRKSDLKSCMQILRTRRDQNQCIYERRKKYLGFCVVLQRQWRNIPLYINALRRPPCGTHVRLEAWLSLGINSHDVDCCHPQFSKDSARRLWCS